MPLDPDTLSVVALAGAGLGAVSLLLAVRAAARVRRVRRILRAVQAGRADLAAALEEGGDIVRRLRDVSKRLEDLELTAQLSVQHVGLVRFDAFEDMGGHLSFAAALLDAEGSGLVLTSINGRQETRIYAKSVERGASRYHLSEEEREAIRRAQASPRA